MSVNKRGTMIHIFNMDSHPSLSTEKKGLNVFFVAKFCLVIF